MDPSVTTSMKNHEVLTLVVVRVLVNMMNNAGYDRLFAFVAWHGQLAPSKRNLPVQVLCCSGHR